MEPPSIVCSGSLLDDKLAAGHIRMCAYALKNLQSPTDSKWYVERICEIVSIIGFYITSVFNIYKDSSPMESQKALFVVERMRTRVEELLSQWPEHPVLMQVSQRRLCDIYNMVP